MIDFLSENSGLLIFAAIIFGLALVRQFLFDEGTDDGGSFDGDGGD